MLANIFVWYALYHEDRRGVLTVAFLDVGQGDAILIDSPTGNQVLIDGGPDSKLLRSLGTMMPFYDRSLDLVLLTHPHSDHFGGFFQLFPRYSIGAFGSSGTQAESPDYRSFENIVHAKQFKEFTVHRGSTFDLGGGTTLTVLLPVGDVMHVRPHDGMLVMRLDYGATSVFLTGDMERNLEAYLVANDRIYLQSSLLKVGHHGSKTSTSELFLGAVHPRFAVISVGAGNRYGHPDTGTLETLQRFGVPVLRTDKNSTIVMRSNGETMTIDEAVQ